jgi:parallel beta-helix repeat protein
MRPILVSVALFLLVSLYGSENTEAFELRRTIDGPVTITESGYYVVTQDISVAIPPAITIMAPNVVIDLAGHTVGTPGFGNGPVIIMNPGSTQLLVRGGMIRGGDHYIQGNAPNLRLSMEHVACADGKQGIAIPQATNISITDSTISCERFPIDIDGSYPLTFERNTISSHQYYSTALFLLGIQSGSFGHNTVSVETYQGGLVLMQSTGLVRVTANVLDGGHGEYGLKLLGGPYIVTGNSITGAHNVAIEISTSGNLVTNNFIDAGNSISTGISVDGSDNTVSGNVIRDRTWGIELAGTENAVSGNSISGASEGGMLISGNGNVISANTVVDNRMGLVFYGSENIYKGNDLRRNRRWFNDVVDYGTNNFDAGGNLVDAPPPPYDPQNTQQEIEGAMSDE